MATCAARPALGCGVGGWGVRGGRRLRAQERATKAAVRGAVMAMRTGGSAARRIRLYSSTGSGLTADAVCGPGSPSPPPTNMHLMVRQDAGDPIRPSWTFNLCDLFELVADAIPEREAMVAGERRLTYAELEDRANRLAHHLLAAGVRAGDHVGLQLLNGTEYVEAMLGAFKIRAVPINVNYRYVDAELAHLFDDADLVAVVLHRQFSPRVAAVKPDLPLLRSLVVVEDGSGEPPPPGAVGYEAPATCFVPGQRVSIGGREATFCYLASAGAAVIPFGSCVLNSGSCTALFRGGNEMSFTLTYRIVLSGFSRGV